MTFDVYIRNALREGFSSDISTSKILVVLLMAAVLGLYVYMIYRLKSKASLYSRDFNNALAALPVITAGIVLAMQSSIVISLGMVGALSIVRFRNAVKNTMDLVFLFWAISMGIIVGAGVFEIAFAMSFGVTVLLFVLDLIPTRKAPYVLVIHTDETGGESDLLPVIRKYAKSITIRSREVVMGRLNMIVEVRTNAENALVAELSAMNSVEHVNLLCHDGEMRF